MIQLWRNALEMSHCVIMRVGFPLKELELLSAAVLRGGQWRGRKSEHWAGVRLTPGRVPPEALGHPLGALGLIEMAGFLPEGPMLEPGLILCSLSHSLSLKLH